MKKLYISLFLIFVSEGLFAQSPSRSPQAERPIERMDLSVNRISYLQAQMPGLNGRGLILSLKEFRFDNEDIDLLDKEIPSGRQAQFVSTHATNMATIIGGLGNSNRQGKGVAPEVFFSSTTFLNIAPEPLDYYLQHNISVQNHSYGIGIENFYGAEARAYDSLVYAAPHLVHVFSAGNIGDSTSTEGPYLGVKGFANLTGTFKQAKNVLTVGAIDPELLVEEQSSRGPAYDGRIKPELVAFGEDGSSGSAAITSGVALLLQQAYAQNQKGQLPPASLIRSILINTTDDLIQPGPDYSSGFGNLNARRALELLSSGQYFLDTLDAKGSLTWSIEVPSNTHQLDVTLAWTDPPGDLMERKALINDLDLWIEDHKGQKFYPWILNPQPFQDSLKAPAKRGLDQLNPQEKVSISDPEAGRYTFHLRNQGEAQAFALSYFLQKSEKLVFTSPNRAESILPDTFQIIRWDWQGPEQEAQLDFKFTHENDWRNIQDAVPLHKGFYAWNTPAQTGSFQLRMVVPDSNFISDTLFISPGLRMDILSDCDNNLLLTWNSAEDIEEYEVYQLLDNRMRPIAQTRDTFFLAAAATFRSVFSVAPVLPSGKIGNRSLALDADFQQRPCYVKNFTARLQEKHGRINFSLLTTYNVRALELQKWNGQEFLPIVNWTINGLDYSFRDQNIELGNNYYRVRIDLLQDQVLFTNTLTIFYVPEDGILVYPNPVPEGQEINFSIPSFQGRSIYVFNSLGQLLVREDIFSPLYRLETNTWSAGFYFFTLLDAAGRSEHKGKFIVK